jgi:uncharacterized membrane protein YcgQ (UPF0703/DUF1980 family)
MVGELVKRTPSAYIVKIMDGIYVPMTRNGIEEISSKDYEAGVKNNLCCGMDERQKKINEGLVTFYEQTGNDWFHLSDMREAFKQDIVRNIEKLSCDFKHDIFLSDLEKSATMYAFDMYLANMRTMIMEQLFSADVVIFNRCDDSTDKGKYRRNVKALNRKAQLVYERADGTLDERPEELPFDITADEIEISDADYAIWYMDCQDNPKKYEGKKVSFLALVYNPDKLKKGIMVPGRFAMTCCVEDVTFIGFKTKYDREDEIPHKSWINITAEVHVEFAKEYKGKGPVLYPISITPAEKPEDELVYFS